MEHAQIFNVRDLSVAHGEPVTIEDSPPGSRFLLCGNDYVGFHVFSIDTGCWCSPGDTQAEAIQNTEITFRKYSSQPTFTAWWVAACLLFEQYLAYMWLEALEKSLAPVEHQSSRLFYHHYN